MPRFDGLPSVLRTTGYAGEIVYANLIGKPVIVLNSFDVVEELLNKRASNYSGRPFLMMSELYGAHDQHVEKLLC
jgi:hypothetical protein